jgi:hypothetical protein
MFMGLMLKLTFRRWESFSVFSYISKFLVAVAIAAAAAVVVVVVAAAAAAVISE